MPIWFAQEVMEKRRNSSFLLLFVAIYLCLKVEAFSAVDTCEKEKVVGKTHLPFSRALLRTPIPYW